MMYSEEEKRDMKMYAGCIVNARMQAGLMKGEIDCESEAELSFDLAEMMVKEQRRRFDKPGVHSTPSRAHG